MRKFLLFLFCQCFSFLAFSQEDYLTVKEFNAANGKFQVAHILENIYRITYYPAGYTTGENISDAVLLKAPAMMGYPFEAKVSHDTVFIRNQAFITGIANMQNSRGFYFPLRPGEMIFGGGERALPLNRRGYRLNLFNNPWYGYSEGADNLNYSVPFITSSRGYGLFFDNPSNGYLDIGKNDTARLEYGASSGELNVYIIFGDYQQVLQSYHKLTGTQPLPPRWALGNLMSRFGYTSETEVKNIYSKMKSEGMPVDAVIFDLFWFGDSIKGTMGNLDWMNRTKWPDPKRMIADFKKEGVQTILVTEPFLVESSKNYKASTPFLAVDSNRHPYILSDFYFGRAGLIDIFRKDAQQWFWQFYKKQMLNGVEAWWGDLGEPEKHPADLFHDLSDLGYKRLFRANEVHNIYGHSWTKMLYNFYAKEFPDKRLFSLNRSGFAGSQRYSIFPWTGDVSRSWSGLKAQLPILLGMSMSGVPYVHSDAGGFAGGEGDKELYIRWLQFASFTPIFRPHGTALYDIEKTAFSFPSEAALIDTPFRNHARDVITGRYRMLPYNYSLSYQQAKWGKPLMAPLYYYFPADTIAPRIQDEFMWGENILVAPVLEKGAKTRTYYLPKGRWYDMTKRKVWEGGNWITDSVSLGYFPVLFKGGGFVPVDVRPIGNQNTNAYKTNEIPVMYFLSEQPSSFELFLDDGVTKGSIEKKLYEIITFSSPGRKNNTLDVKVNSNGGNYMGKPASRLVYLMIPGGVLPAKLLINGNEIKRQANQQILSPEGGARMVNGDLMIHSKFTGKPLVISLIW